MQTRYYQSRHVTVAARRRRNHLSGLAAILVTGALFFAFWSACLTLGQL